MDRIKIYTNETCPYCVQVKEMFEKENIKFIEKVTSKNVEEYQKIVNLTGIPTVPNIKYKNEYFIPGRDFKTLDQLLGIIKNYQKSNYSQTRIILEKVKTLNYNEYVQKEYATQEDEVVSTTLNGSHSSTVATLTLTSTTGLDTSGTVHIAGEQVTYTAISGNDITGCTRGANSTTAETHSSGVTVTQFEGGGVPRQIVRTPDNNYLLYPYPDKQYTLAFDYYTFPSDLSAHGDTTSVPDRFGPVIVDGATAYVYMYRGEQAHYQLNFQRFEDGIKNMQSLLINKYDYVRSSMITRPGSSMNFTSGVVT